MTGDDVLDLVHEGRTLAAAASLRSLDRTTRAVLRDECEAHERLLRLLAIQMAMLAELERRLAAEPAR